MIKYSIYALTKHSRYMEVPHEVVAAAKEGLRLKESGYAGGTKTGVKRAKQLVSGRISEETARVMRAWFARHGPQAKHGGTSYPGYVAWIRAGRPDQPSNHRGAVAWLLWGGNPAQAWLGRRN